MSKLDNLTFYSKLQDLFDSIEPREVPVRINEALTFVHQNMEAYEARGNNSLTEAEDGYDMLVWVKQVFEESLTPVESWTFILTNQTLGYQINLKPIYNFLYDNEDFTSKLECMTETWHHLIDHSNVDEYKKIQPIVNALKHTFSDSTYGNW